MIEPTIVTALSSIFSGRVYPDTAPPDAVMPVCTFQQVGGQPVTTFCGSVSRNARMQINVWSSSRSQANTLMRSAAAALTTSLQATPLGELTARYEDVTRTYGAQQDFSFWF